MNPENLKEDENSGETDENFIPPKDGSWVPRTVMNERVDSARDKLSAELQVEREARVRLEEQVKTLSISDQSSPPAKVYTLSELRLAVEGGTITQDQADSVYEKQQDAKVDKRVQSSLDDFKTVTTSTAALASGLQGYMDLLPDLMKPDSKDRTKVSEAYNGLTKVFGLPQAESLEDKKLQLAALQQCFGSVDELKQKIANSKSTSDNRETYQESSNSGEPADPKVDSFVNGLGKERKAHYKKLIDSGMYPDWKAVQEEMKYAKR